LAAGLRPDPLGELTALPQTPNCMKRGKAGYGNERGKATGSKEETRDQGKGTTVILTGHDLSRGA